jgi:hypothetical protein
MDEIKYKFWQHCNTFCPSQPWAKHAINKKSLLSSTHSSGERILLKNTSDYITTTYKVHIYYVAIPLVCISWKLSVSHVGLRVIAVLT